jgi:hypothetical protein
VADRFCGNCDQQLKPGDKYCANCGHTVHTTAVVPTPEAEVPVPPLPHSLPDQQPKESEGVPRSGGNRLSSSDSTRNAYFALGVVAWVIALWIALAAGSGSGAMMVVIIGLGFIHRAF